MTTTSAPWRPAASARCAPTRATCPSASSAAASRPTRCSASCCSCATCWPGRCSSRHQGQPELLGRVLDVYEPAANRIAVTVGVSFVEERERMIREQQAAIRQRADMLHRLSTFLADASLALDAPGSLEEILQLVAEHARELVGADALPRRDPAPRRHRDRGPLRDRARTPSRSPFRRPTSRHSTPRRARSTLATDELGRARRRARPPRPRRADDRVQSDAQLARRLPQRPRRHRNSASSKPSTNAKASSPTSTKRSWSSSPRWHQRPWSGHSATRRARPHSPRVGWRRMSVRLWSSDGLAGAGGRLDRPAARRGRARAHGRGRAAARAAVGDRPARADHGRRRLDEGRRARRRRSRPGSTSCSPARRRASARADRLDPARGWMLLPDGGPPLASVEAGLGAEAALGQYGRLQRALAPHAGELPALGVPDMRPEAMPERFEEALDAARASAPAGGGDEARWPAWRRCATTWRAGASGSPPPRAREPRPQRPARAQRPRRRPVPLLRLGRRRPRARVRGACWCPRRCSPASRSSAPAPPTWRPSPTSRRRSELAEELALACRVATVARALTWERALRSARDQGEPIDPVLRPRPLRGAHGPRG